MILADSDQCCITHCGWVCISLAIVQLAWEEMPLGRWGKLAMTVQAVCSLMILGLVTARTVNVFK
jgi:hypothetical protein